MGSQLLLVMMRICCGSGCGCVAVVVVLMMLITAGWSLGGKSIVVGDDENVGCGFHDADNGAWVRRMLLFNNRFHNDNAMILRWAMF